MQVTYFHRKPRPDANFSIELIFENVRRELAGHIDARICVAPCYSNGLFRRLWIAGHGRRHQGELNHVTGDIHFLALSLDPRRTVLTIHDCHALTRLSGWKRRVLKRYWFDLPASHVAAITVVSEETKRELEKYVPAARGKTIVIPNAVDPIFQPAFKAFPPSRPRILQIGTAPNKNLARLASALEGIDCELQVVGRLSERDREALEATGVQFTTAQDLSPQEIYRCYCEADVISFPSTYEGFGLPIIEAQWVERPVVTSNCSSMPDVAGDGACLVNPFSVESIREGFRRVISDSAHREALVFAGRQNRARFSYAAVAEQYADLYRRLLKS
jgi:glycosyltransferase involved in cell wall biosynthesis